MTDRIISEDVRQIRSRLGETTLEAKNVLVSGGSGFLGSYLCDVLIEMGCEVTCLDDFSTGLPQNIDNLTGNKNFKIVESDVTHSTINDGYDHILHFAARASPEDYQLHPVKTMLANAFGSYQLLESARKSDATILFASSSEVYGDAVEVPTTESYWGNVNPTGVRSCYDEGKRFGEALFMAYHRSCGLDTRIVRIFNTYGPRLRADGAYARALSRFVLQALRGESLTVYGDGSQTRSFCYVTDTIAGILSALASNSMKGDVVNIGNPQEVSILDLAKKIRETAGSASGITFHPLPEDDPKRRRPDITKAEKLLSWKAEVNLEDGLDRTIRWFRDRSLN